MKHNFHKIAKFTTLTLVSSLPFSVEVLADAEKKQSAVKSFLITNKNSPTIKRKVLAEKSQQIVNEARDSISGTQQALIALEKNDTKAALEILQDVSKKLAVILDKNFTLASIITEMEADIFNFEGNSNTVKKELKQIDDLLEDETLQSVFLLVPFYKRLKMQQL